jgi:hypothetical protein
MGVLEILCLVDPCNRTSLGFCGCRAIRKGIHGFLSPVEPSRRSLWPFGTVGVQKYKDVD